ncbi:endonuclease/exonuclease/phosphatase family protein [Sphingomonas faeni]|uniref:endonuclease/exonuclease/phosphatase family protein n=1 Tax=Sphingomonas faeni TaxID=185950 RepID=UPI002784C8E9|nr:endonuclease/exonuclease/phosphatase family protein [Sphingomonas faeni]MDQ0839956.1 endonuclease/exonuclease/phosphatase family metal-dependent hydrolase [Sphingomonas faeni]
MHRSVISIIAVIALGGCVSLPAPLLSECSQGGVPPIEVSSDGRTASTTFDVLSYNIEGLAWPARGKRGGSLREIALRLADLRRSGKAPDVVMVQEMFSRTAVRSMTNIGYANVVTGPARTQQKRLPALQPMPRPYNLSRGEVGFHAVNSGLAIFSRFPIIYTLSEPYGVHRCAGFDCLSNKGMLFARIAIPNVPVAIDLINTHLNSQDASRVSPTRHLQAHGLQTVELDAFVRRNGSPKAAMVLGGDFNMKDSPERFRQFENVSNQMTMVHEWCSRQRLFCDVQMSWDGDAPWMDTQDLQLFRSPPDTMLVPIRVQAMFDGSKGNPKLSDHDGLLVTYRLTWNVNSSKILALNEPQANVCLAR